MSNKPSVSIIVIFFNANVSFFVEAIESILLQTYIDWELLLVDDGSTDGSTEIARNYAYQYPEKVRYLEHERHQNRGMSATRNLGIRHAKGEYIAFLDADDIWLPHKLEQQVSIMKDNPDAAMLYGRTQYWSSWAKNLGNHQPDTLTKTSITFDSMVKPPRQLLLYLKSGGGIYPCMCSILIRHKAIKEIGGFEESFKNANEDMVFHSKIFLRFPVYVSSKCWDKYRMNPDSFWHVAQKENIDIKSIARLNYLTWLKGYLAESNIRDLRINLEVYKALFLYRHPVLNRLIEYANNFRKNMKGRIKKAIKYAIFFAHKI